MAGGGHLQRRGRAKPKGMRWRTFERPTAEHEALVGESLAEMARRRGILKAELEGFREG